MPVVAVAAAFYSVGAAATAGFATLTAFQTIAVVSSVVGAVGAVTGNKTLQKIGLIGSVVGGIGSFAQASGWLEGAGLAKDSGAAFNKAFTSGDLFNPTPGATPVVPGATVSGAVPTAEGGAGLEKAQSALTTAEGSAGIDKAVTGSVAPPSAAGAATAAGDAGTKLTAVQQLAEQKAATALANAAGENGLWGSFQSFAATNPTLTFAGVTTAGNAIAGLFDPTVEGTVAKNAAEAALRQNEASILAQQKANMAAPLPQIRGPQNAQNVMGYGIDPVTGKAVAPRTVAPGLLNTVTGVPA